MRVWVSDSSEEIMEIEKQERKKTHERERFRLLWIEGWRAMREISIKDRFRPAVDTQGSGPTTSNFNERISKLTMKWQVEPQPRRQLSDENVCFPLVPRGMWCFPLHWVSCPHLSLPPFRFHLLSSALRWITFIHPLLTRHLSSFLTRLSETLPAGSDCSECGGLFLLVCLMSM